MTYLGFDTETTGLHDNAEIAQLAMMLFDDNKECIGEFKSLIKPDGWTISEETQKFHTDSGSTVSQENCEKYGLSIKSVMALFNNWCDKADELIAHNLDYDIARIRYTANRLGLQLNMPHQHKCTMKLSTDILKIPPTAAMKKWGHGDKFKNPNLQEAHKHFFGKEFDGAHDAMADVKACASIYFEIIG